MQPKNKRPRVSNAKSKTGCFTCKIRRVKCDERKPACVRCETFGTVCDGYPDAATPPKKAVIVERRPIQPRLTALYNYTPTISVPGNEDERRYYQLFSERTAVDLQGYFPTDFWNRTVLQESHLEPFVRHAVIALGALTKTCIDSRLDPTSVTLTSTGQAKKHHEFALCQYNKAIVKLRQVLSKRRVELRKALIACLLFVCFENFHGYYDAGIQHMQCGLSLLDQWRTEHLRSAPEGDTSDDHLAALVHDEVFQMFARLDAQAFAHLGSESSLYTNVRLLLWKTVSQKGFKIPTVFADVVEARRYWDILMQRTIYFHKLLLSSIYDDGGAPDQGVVVEHDICKTLSLQYDEAIQPLLQSQEEDDLYSTSVTATILCSANRISSMFLETCNRPGEARYDRYTARFADILQKLAPILEKAKQNHSQNPVNFKFDLGYVLPLHLIAMKCREPQLRRKAIAMLVATPDREGDWDGLLLSRVDTWLMHLEEETMDDTGYVPEHGRWRLTKVESNLPQRWIRAEYGQGVYEEAGNWKHVAKSKVANITW